MSDLAVTLLLLVAVAAVAAIVASVIGRPRARLTGGAGSSHRRDLDRPHRQAVQHFASGALPPWR
jgi:hypothetical protein